MNAKLPSVETLFAQALELPSAAERAAYLERACAGNENLRRDVQTLLEAHERAGAFLEPPEPGATSDHGEPPAPQGEGPGTTIGPYKLLEEIGEGGMGIVYLAEQTRSVRRKVALKVIKPGMDTKQVIARFEAERQALALMEHPSIARVLDAGATDTGRPYFVMELARGVPITEYCDANHLGLDERLDLFVLVCQAVQHAHQKGIIHRDLKPSNVLVVLQDGEPVPKVIDFGIAKATGQSLTDKTLFTGFAQLVGTPMYMSPEQAAMAGMDVDTRSDVYSLGVLLYELLTGTTPFDHEAFRTAALGEIQRIIREEEPPKPSTRLSTLSATPATVPAHSRSDVRKLVHAVRGDLDWIVMKALEKDRRRRYETANGLAADVMRYRTDKPVEACPPSSWYRFRKYARRHKAILTTVILVAAAMVIGTVVSVWQAVRATRAEATANANEAKAQAATQAEAKERRRAEDLTAQGRRRQVALTVEQGTRLMNDGDLAGALRYFVEALRLDDDPAREVDHRVRLNALLAQCVKPARIWFHGATIESVELRPDLGAVAVALADGTITISDASTGMPLGPVLKHLTAGTRQGRKPLSLSLSPDGLRIAVACQDATVRVFEVAAGRECFATPPHTSLGVRFSADGMLLLVNNTNNWRIWDARTGQPVSEQIRAARSGHWARLSPDNRVVAVPVNEYNTPRSLGLHDARTGRPVIPAIPSNQQLTLIQQGSCFSPDARRIVTSSSVGARVWDTATGAALTPLMSHLWSAAATFSPDARRVLTWSEDGIVRVWDAATGAACFDALRHPGIVEGAVFSHDGNLVATRCSDHAVRVWDATTGRPLLPPLWHLGPVAELQFSRDGRSLFTASGDRMVRRWDLTAASPADPGLPGVEPGQQLRFSPDGRLMVSYGTGGTVHIWDTTTGAASAPPVVVPARALAAGEISPDGRLLAVLDNDTDQRATAWIWDLTTRQKKAGPLVHEYKEAVPNDYRHTRLIAWSPDSRRLAVAAGSNPVRAPFNAVIRVWDAETGAPVTPAVANPLFMPKSLEFSPDGQSVVTAGSANGSTSFSSQLRFVDVDRGVLRIGRNERPYSDGIAARYSPDGRRLLTVSSGNRGDSHESEVRVWEAATDQPLSPPIHRDPVAVHDAFFLPDARHVVTVSDTMRVWDAVTGTLTRNPTPFPFPIGQVSLGPDGRRLLVTYRAGFAQVVDLATGWPITPHLGRERIVAGACFSPDGRWVASTGPRGGALLWKLRPDNHTLEDLVRIAEVLSGTRVDGSGDSVRITVDELREAYETLLRKDPETFTARTEQVLGWHHQQLQLCEAAGHRTAALTHLDWLIAHGAAVELLGARRDALFTRLMPDEKIPYYREQVRLKPDDSVAHRELGLALQGKGTHGEAIAEFHEAIRLKPDDVSARLGLGNALRGQGKADDAIAVYREALRLDPSGAEVHDGLARALAGKGLRKEAIEEYRAAARLKPDGLPWTRFELVWHLANAPETDLRNPAEALEHARKGVEITQGKHPGFYGPLALAEYRSGHWNEALAACEQITKTGGKEDGLIGFVQALAHTQMGKPELARPCFDKGITWMRAQSHQSWDYRRLWTEAAGLLGLPGPDGPLKPEELVAVYREQVRLKPDDATAHHELARALQASGSHDDAITEFRAAIRLQPNDAAAHHELALALGRKGLHDEAIVEFREAVRLKVDDTGVHQGLAVALQGKGLHEEAIAEFREVIRLKPDDVAARLGLGDSLRRRGQLDEAIAVYREALGLDPNHAELHDGLARVLNGKGLRAEAIAEFREAARLEPEGLPWARFELVWLLANAPETDLRNPAEALEHARKGVEITGEESPGFFEMLALAEYRSGHWDEALAALDRVEPLGGQENGLSLFLQALIHVQTGNRDLARRCFDGGVAWMKAQTYQAWDYRRLWTEAAGLLGLPGPDAR